MRPMILCPEVYDTSKGCKKRFCKYINQKGKCSLDFEVENKEYEMGVIADTLQTSRQRVWRLYDVAISKLQRQLNGKFN